MNEKRKDEKSQAEASKLVSRTRTNAQIHEDVQVMKAVLVFNEMVKADKMTYLTYCGIKNHIPDMCKAIKDNQIFQNHYKDIKIERLLSVWPQVMHLRREDLEAVIKSLEESIRANPGTTE